MKPEGAKQEARFSGIIHDAAFSEHLQLQTLSRHNPCYSPKHCTEGAQVSGRIIPQDVCVPKQACPMPREVRRAFARAVTLVITLRVWL